MRILQTERLVLRPFQDGDAGMMYTNWTSDPQVARYCRWYAHENQTVTEGLLQMYLAEAASGFVYRWAITLKGSDEPVGAIDVVGISDDGTSAEVGYVLSQRLWNKGIITEALCAVISCLFASGFDKVTACYHTGNPASGRVMEKCGMKFVGIDQVPEKFGSDKLCEVKCYEISAK